MSEPAPGHVPLFRSEQQLRILAVFTNPEDEFAIGEIAQRADVAQATVSREVARRADWDSHSPEPFIAQIKDQPLTPIPLIACRTESQTG